jgi:hypothetical protein
MVLAAGSVDSAATVRSSFDGAVRSAVLSRAAGTGDSTATSRRRFFDTTIATVATAAVLGLPTPASAVEDVTMKGNMPDLPPEAVRSYLLAADGNDDDLAVQSSPPYQPYQPPPPPPPLPKVIIVGAGFAGLAVAYRLRGIAASFDSGRRR